MKQTNSASMKIYIFALLSLNSALCAAVSLNDALLEASSPYTIPPFDRAFYLNSTNSPEDTWTGVAFQSPISFYFEALGLSSAFQLVEIEKFDEFSVSTVDTYPSFVDNSLGSPSNTLLLNDGETAMFGVWVDMADDGIGPGGKSANDLYGWVEFTNTMGELVVSDSASASSDGIIAGTAQQVPEPNAVVLFWLSTSFIMLKRFR